MGILEWAIWIFHKAQNKTITKCVPVISQHSMMENVLLRFPHLGEAIFQKVDNKSLATCQIVSTSWYRFIQYQKQPKWIRVKHRLVKNLETLFKGQLISKCLLGVIIWTKIPTKFFPGFLPQPLKRCQIKKIKALYYTNQGLFNIIGIIKFLIQPHFRGQGRNAGKNFIGILVQTMTPQRHFEIN